MFLALFSEHRNNFQFIGIIQWNHENVENKKNYFKCYYHFQEKEASKTLIKWSTLIFLIEEISWLHYLECLLHILDHFLCWLHDSPLLCPCIRGTVSVHWWWCNMTSVQLCVNACITPSSCTHVYIKCWL
jgi:hypothetical protein